MPVLGYKFVLGSRIVHVGEGFFIWVEAVGGFGCSAGEEVSAEVGEEFPNFGIGGDEREDVEGLQIRRND